MRLSHERSLQPPDPKPILGEAIRYINKSLWFDNIIDLPIALDHIDKTTGKHIMTMALEEAEGDSALEDALWTLRTLIPELRSISDKVDKAFSVIDNLIMMEDDDERDN